MLQRLVLQRQEQLRKDLRPLELRCLELQSARGQLPQRLELLQHRPLRQSRPLGRAREWPRLAPPVELERQPAQTPQRPRLPTRGVWRLAQVQ